MSEFIRLKSYQDTQIDIRKDMIYSMERKECVDGDMRTIISGPHGFMQIVDEFPDEIAGLLEDKFDPTDPKHLPPAEDQWRPLSWIERHDLQEIYREALALDITDEKTRLLLNLILEVEKQCRVCFTGKNINPDDPKYLMAPGYTNLTVQDLNDMYEQAYPKGEGLPNLLDISHLTPEEQKAFRERMAEL